MGRVVGRAVLDDAQVERGQLLIAALADLDAPHFRLLAELGRAEDSQSAAAIPVPEPLRAALIRHGVVEAGPSWSGNIIVTGVSDFGRELLSYVRDEGATL